MADYVSPTTELEAVNDMLDAIDESPVAGFDETVPDAERALSLLRRVSKAVQLKGWEFNTERGKVIQVVDGELALPANTLKVDTVNCSAEHQLVYRAGKLWDTKTGSFQAPEGLTEVEVDVVLEQDFEDLPESARLYVSTRAGRIFLSRRGFAGQQVGYAEKDEVDALAAMEADDADAADVSFLHNPEYHRLYPRPRTRF